MASRFSTCLVQTAGDPEMKKELFDSMRMQAWITARLASEADSDSGAIAFANQVVKELEARFTKEVERETFDAVSSPQSSATLK
jgi:hypothetical protein